MQQKQRNKIMWILIVVLVPLLIYLLATNVAKVGKTPPPQEPAATVAAGQVVPPAEVQPPTRPAAPVDPKVSAEQKRISMLLPKNNPFNPARTISADQSPAIAAPTPPVAAPPPVVSDTGIKLMAIVARGGGRMAMINGRFLGEGDRIANWTIIKVTNSDVLLKDGDRQMVLKLK